MPIQPREVAVMKYLDGFIKAHGCAPTQRQIAEHFSFRSKHYASDILKRLAGMGYVRVMRHHRRGIEVIRMPDLNEGAYQVYLPIEVDYALRRYSADCHINPETAIMEAVRAYLTSAGL